MNYISRYLHKFAAGSVRIANSNFRSAFRNFRKFSKIAANFNKAVVINLWLYREFLQIHVTLHSAIGMQPTSTSPIRSAWFRETYKRYFDTISPAILSKSNWKVQNWQAAEARAAGCDFFPESPYHFSSLPPSLIPLSSLSPFDSFARENAEKCNAARRRCARAHPLRYEISPRCRQSTY